jgi:integrase
MRARVKHEKRVKDRYGRVRYYHQVTGERLPDDQEKRLYRLLQINQSLPAKTARGGPQPGTFADIIKRYRDSPEFAKLAAKTRREYGRQLDAIEAALGPFAATDLKPRHVVKMRDKLQDKPREANYRKAVLRILCKRAIRDGYRRDDPTAAVPNLKEGPGYQAWPDDVFNKAVQASDKPLADYFRLLRWTGQRPQDVIAMTWQAVDRQSGHIEVRQQKTGQYVWIPLHPGLLAILDDIPKRAPQILTRASGRPWTSVNELARRTREVMREIGESGYTPHGLRHTAGDALAEAGCSTHEIQAILGHASTRSSERYTKTADRKRLARSASVKRFKEE